MDMHVVIVGYEIEGKSSAAYWEAQGHEVTIADQNPDLVIPGDFHPKLGPDYLQGLDAFDLIVRTPGIHPKQIFEANPEAPEIAKKITSNVNEFLANCPSKNIIGVTGTKGKGTTSSLVTKMLQAGGKIVHLGGNIGVAPLDLLPHIHEDHWVVLELSNFQLIDCTHSPHIAVCLMMAPEHLNWHKDSEEYFKAKQNLFAHQTASDLAIYNVRNRDTRTIVSVSKAHKVGYEVPAENALPDYRGGAYVLGNSIYYQDKLVCRVNEVKLPGRHNLENICAAIATAWQPLGGNIETIKNAIIHFEGLEHRIEFIRELNGVSYYNDSFATTPETSIACIKAFKEPKVLLAGGSDKGISLEPLVDEIIAQDVKYVVILGTQMGNRIAEMLHQKGYDSVSEPQNSMADAVTEAAGHAEDGGVVLLSTGCASFDMFKNYKDRGEQFKQAVLALQ